MPHGKHGNKSLCLLALASAGTLCDNGQLCAKMLQIWEHQTTFWKIMRLQVLQSYCWMAKKNILKTFRTFGLSYCRMRHTPAALVVANSWTATCKASGACACTKAGSNILTMTPRERITNWSIPRSHWSPFVFKLDPAQILYNSQVFVSPITLEECSPLLPLGLDLQTFTNSIKRGQRVLAYPQST